jgi:hypothetical protein
VRFAQRAGVAPAPDSDMRDSQRTLALIATAPREERFA